MTLDPQTLGYIAGFFTTASFLPQALKTLKTHNTQGISLTMYAMFVVGICFWLAYGLVQNDPTIIVANSITLLLASPILILKLRNRD